MNFGKVFGAITSSLNSATNFCTDVSKRIGGNDFKGPIAQLSKGLSKSNYAFTYRELLAAYIIYNHRAELTQRTYDLLQPSQEVPLNTRNRADNHLMTLALRCAKHSKASYGTSAFNDGEFPRLPDESDASYAQRGTVAAIRRFVGPDVEASDILECCSGSSVYDVAHYVALDNSAGAVVVAFRGTAGVEDAFTDLAAEDTGYALSTGPGKETLTGLAHIGIAASARSKYLTIIGTVERAVATMFAPPEGEKVNEDEDDDFEKVKPFVLVTGHSLGGGVASLVALDIASRHPEWRVEAYTFGSAASLSENISQSEYARKIVRAFVMRDDVVPRMSLAALEWLKCLAKHVAEYANDASSQAQAQQKTFFNSAVEWAAKKTIGGTNVDMDAAVDAARKEFAARNPTGPKFLYPAGRLFWVKPKPPPPPKPLTASTPSEDCAPPPPTPPKPLITSASSEDCAPPPPPKPLTISASSENCAPPPTPPKPASSENCAPPLPPQKPLITSASSEDCAPPPPPKPASSEDCAPPTPPKPLITSASSEDCAPPPPPPKPLTVSAPSGGCAPPLPPKPRKNGGGEGGCPPPLPPKNKGSGNALVKIDNTLMKSEDEETNGKERKEDKEGKEEEKEDLFKFGMDVCETPGVKWLEEIRLTDTFITDHYMKNYLSAMNEFFK